MSTVSYETPNWPASREHLQASRQFLREIKSKKDERPILIVPDRDVDGLTSGGIMQRVVSRILLKDNTANVPVQVRFMPKGVSINESSEREAIDEVGAR
jgi:single-stranded DNA-specific DHH superfamily exonuclease